MTGAAQWRRTFELLDEILGSSALLHAAAIVFIAIGSVGGVLVLAGAYMFRQDRVRLGRLLILLGTGFTLASLVLFVVLSLRHGEWPFAGSAAFGAVGIVFSIVARRVAKPKPLLK